MALSRPSTRTRGWCLPHCIFPLTLTPWLHDSAVQGTQRSSIFSYISPTCNWSAVDNKNVGTRDSQVGFMPYLELSLDYWTLFGELLYYINFGILKAEGNMPLPAFVAKIEWFGWFSGWGIVCARFVAGVFVFACSRWLICGIIRNNPCRPLVALVGFFSSDLEKVWSVVWLGLVLWGSRLIIYQCVWGPVLVEKCQGSLVGAFHLQKYPFWFDFPTLEAINNLVCSSYWQFLTICVWSTDWPLNPSQSSGAGDLTTTTQDVYLDH